MKQILLKSFLIAVITLIGVQNLMADQGPWKCYGWKYRAATDDDISYSYNSMNNTSWGGTWSLIDDGNGMHVANNTNSENFGNLLYKYQIFYLLAHAPLEVPSYCKVKRTQRYSIFAGSDYYYSIFNVLFLGDEYTATHMYFNSSETNNAFTVYGKTAQESNDRTATIYYDNSTISTASIKDYFLLFTGCITNGNLERKRQYAEGGFKNKSYSDKYIYYKYITFDANEGSGSAMAQQTIEESGTLTANSYTRPGYRFIGWNTQANGEGTAYTDGAAIAATSEDKGPVTLYAQWETVAVPVSESGSATIFSDKNVVVPAGVEVYGFTYSDGALVQSAKISEGAVLPAYNGYLVKASAAGTYNFATTDAAATVPGSDVTGTTTEITTPSGAIYVWGKPDGYNYGWYRYTGATIPAGKAYFDIRFINGGINDMNINTDKDF